MRETRKSVMAGADGIVFVADSREERFEATQRSHWDCRKALAELRLDPDRIPFAYQFNERDETGAIAPDVFDEVLEVRTPSFLACATSGYQVFATLDWVTQQVLANFHSANSEHLTTVSKNAANPSIQSLYTKLFRGLKGKARGEIFNRSWR